MDRILILGILAVQITFLFAIITGDTVNFANMGSVLV